MRKKRMLSFLLASILTASTMFPVYADTTSEKISDAKAQKEQAENNLEQKQTELDGLESQKSELEQYLEELNNQYTQATADLKEKNQQYADKQEELRKAKAELKTAKRTEAEYYQGMKKRIAIMYQNSSTSNLERLLSADSFAEFLNTAQNIQEINNYDRDMREKYEDAMKKSAEQKKRVEEEQEELERLKQEAAEKREEVDGLIADTDAKVAAYAEEINANQAQVNSLLERVNSQEAQLNELLEQAQKEEEEAARQKAAAEERARQEQEAMQQAQESNDTSARTQEENQDKPQQETTGTDESSTDFTADDLEDSGSGESAGTGSAGSQTADTSQGTYLGNFKLTAYCNCAQCCGTAGNATASGVMPSTGHTVAMAGVPFGTQLLINGSVYTVEDLGTPYGHVDIYMGSHSEALSFGLQYADVYRLN